MSARHIVEAFATGHRGVIHWNDIPKDGFPGHKAKALRAALCRMLAKGVLVRAGVGRYRLVATMEVQQ